MQKIILKSLPKQKTQTTFQTSPWEDFKAFKNGGVLKKMKIPKNLPEFIIAESYLTSRIWN